MADRSHSNLKSRFRYAWYEYLRIYCNIVGVLFLRVRYFGLRNVLDLTPGRGLVIISNHQSHFDPPLIGMGMQIHLCYMARESLFRFGPFAWLIRSLDAIPINRDGIGLGGIKAALRLLKGGRAITLFPEGTRTTDGTIGKFKPGFSTLARRTRVPILPVAIEGAFDVWPKGNLLPGFGHVFIRYGRPIEPEEYETMDERELVAEVRRRVGRALEQLHEHPRFAKRRR